MKIGKRFKKNILILLSDPGCISIIEYEINELKKKYNTDVYLLNNYKFKNNAISKNIISNKIFLKNIRENKYKLIFKDELITSSWPDYKNINKFNKNQKVHL